jgi:hypothetical protein
MAWDSALPYGMRDIGLKPFSDAGLTTLGALVDNPIARTMSFEEAEDFEELRGDDKVIAIRGKGASVNWELENGGISIPAFKTMNGGSSTTTGTTPNQVTSYNKKVTDARPYFQAEGQSISDSGGDFHARILRARADDSLTGDLEDGAFWLTGAKGRGLPALTTGKVDWLYEFILNETATAIA